MCLAMHEARPSSRRRWLHEVMSQKAPCKNIAARALWLLGGLIAAKGGQISNALAVASA